MMAGCTGLWVSACIIELTFYRCEYSIQLFHMYLPLHNRELSVVSQQTLVVCEVAEVLNFAMFEYMTVKPQCLVMQTN